MSESVPRFGFRDSVVLGDPEMEDPFLVDVSATFVHESGARIRHVPAFYDGDGRWVVRFSPTKCGTWTGATHSSDSVLDGVDLPPCLCVPGDLPGTLRLDPDHPTRFVRSDGSNFSPIGFECDWLFSYHQRDPEACLAALDLLRARGFNYIVTNVYAHTGFGGEQVDRPGRVEPEHLYGPPDLYVFGGTNEAPDQMRLSIPFFRDFDAMMVALRDRGFVVHLMVQVQNKRVNWPRRRSVQDDLYWRYVVARYQALGCVVWDVGKESYNLLRETGSHDYTLDRIVLMRRADAYHNLVTVHDPEGGSPGRNCVVDLAADFVSDQVHLGDCHMYNREAIRRQRAAGRPYMNIEYGYERGAEELKTYTSGTTAAWDEVLKWTWSLIVAGGHPCYYYSNAAWDLIKFSPEPPGWRLYGAMSTFLSLVPLNRMVPDNELVARGFCLADPGHDYLVFLPAGGEAVIDLTALSEDQPSLCRWMSVTTGDMHTIALREGRRFSTVLKTPLTDPSAPAVLHIDADEVLR